MQENVITWNQVKKIHKTVTGIYTVDRKALSLIVNCNTKGRYPNKVTKSEITYVFGPSTPFWQVESLLKAVETADKLRVFQKLDVNRWEDLGYWTPTSLGDETDGYWPIKLKPAR